MAATSPEERAGGAPEVFDSPRSLALGDATESVADGNGVGVAAIEARLGVSERVKEGDSAADEDIEGVVEPVPLLLG
jgi:hypothetical protein